MPTSSLSAVLGHVSEFQDAVVRRNTREIVADKVISLIASGILHVGDLLPGERDLAAAFQVSRESVRGGMQILSARGVVEISHGARTKVITSDVGSSKIGVHDAQFMNSYDLESIHSSRLLVERSVVASSANLISDETIAFLENALSAQLDAIDDPVRFLISDQEFHIAIYRSCGNPVLADFVCDLYTYMLDHRRNAMSRIGAIQKSYNNHVDIVNALKNHDAVAVVAAFEVHLDRILSTTRSILNSEAIQLSIVSEN